MLPREQASLFLKSVAIFCSRELVGGCVCVCFFYKHIYIYIYYLLLLCLTRNVRNLNDVCGGGI